MPAPEEQPESASSPSGPSPSESSQSGSPQSEPAEPQPPLKVHGDALLDGSGASAGSTQGTAPDPAQDAAPHE